MLGSPAEPEFGQKDAPLPSILAYNESIEGFVLIAGLDAAFKWVERMLARLENLANDVNNTENKGILYRPSKSTPRSYEVARIHSAVHTRKENWFLA
jgi:hypothetical protein